MLLRYKAFSTPRLGLSDQNLYIPKEMVTCQQSIQKKQKKEKKKKKATIAICLVVHALEPRIKISGYITDILVIYPISVDTDKKFGKIYPSTDILSIFRFFRVSTDISAIFLNILLIFH